MDFVSWRFLIFTAVFCLLIYLQFHLSRRQWNRLKGEQASEIDVNYVRLENYLAQSFRMKVREWLRLPVSQDKDVGPVVLKGQERIRKIAELRMSDHENCDDILIVDHDFACGEACNLTREVLVHGRSYIGSSSHLQSFASDGDLIIGENVSVARWLDSGGEMILGAGCKVGARATSLTRIRMGQGVEVDSVSAPEVATEGGSLKILDENLSRPELVDVIFPAGPDTNEESLFETGLDPHRFLRLGEDTWLYRGDFQPSVPVRIKNKLVIHGDCSFPRGSLLESDVKANGSIFLEQTCRTFGNLVSEGDIFLGQGCQFSGLIHAGRTLTLSHGTRGFHPHQMIAAYAEAEVKLEEKVAVKGKIASGGRVIVAKGPGMETANVQVSIREEALTL